MALWLLMMCANAGKSVSTGSCKCCRTRPHGTASLAPNSWSTCSADTFSPPLIWAQLLAGAGQPAPCPPSTRRRSRSCAPAPPHSHPAVVGFVRVMMQSRLSQLLSSWLWLTAPLAGMRWSWDCGTMRHDVLCEVIPAAYVQRGQSRPWKLLCVVPVHTFKPRGCTVVAFCRVASTSCCTGPAQNTKDAKVEKRMPAPYTQHSAGKVYRITCAQAIH